MPVVCSFTQGSFIVWTLRILFLLAYIGAVMAIVIVVQNRSNDGFNAYVCGSQYSGYYFC